jgi:Protein of unknown function (DUF3037)
VPAPVSFDYAVIRVVPRVEREEFVNAGVILFCFQRDFLAVRIDPGEALQQAIRALWPETDLEPLRQHLEALPRIAAGDPEGGPVARLTQRERFHWLVSPRSTVIQISPVHVGLCEEPEKALDAIYRRMVARGAE